MSGYRLTLLSYCYNHLYVEKPNFIAYTIYKAVDGCILLFEPSSLFGDNHRHYR